MSLPDVLKAARDCGCVVAEDERAFVYRPSDEPVQTVRIAGAEGHRVGTASFKVLECAASPAARLTIGGANERNLRSLCTFAGAGSMQSLAIHASELDTALDVVRIADRCFGSGPDTLDPLLNDDGLAKEFISRNSHVPLLPVRERIQASEEGSCVFFSLDAEDSGALHLNLMPTMAWVEAFYLAEHMAEILYDPIRLDAAIMDAREEAKSSDYAFHLAMRWNATQAPAHWRMRACVTNGRFFVRLPFLNKRCNPGPTGAREFSAVREAMDRDLGLPRVRVEFDRIGRYLRPVQNKLMWAAVRAMAGI